MLYNIHWVVLKCLDIFPPNTFDNTASVTQWNNQHNICARLTRNTAVCRIQQYLRTVTILSSVVIKMVCEKRKILINIFRVLEQVWFAFCPKILRFIPPRDSKWSQDYLGLWTRITSSTTVNAILWTEWHAPRATLAWIRRATCHLPAAIGMKAA